MEKKVTVDTGRTRPQVTPGRVRGGMGRCLLSPGSATKLPVPGKDVISGSTALGNVGGAEGADGCTLFVDHTPCSWVASWT